MSGKTKKLLRQIRQAAQNMPAVPVKTKMRISGAEIIAKNKDAHDGKGNPIDAKKFYIVPALEPRNHEKEMKKLLRQGGKDAVALYAKEVIEAAKAKQKQGVPNE